MWCSCFHNDHNMWQGDCWKKTQKNPRHNQLNHHQHLWQLLKPKGLHTTYNWSRIILLYILLYIIYLFNWHWEQCNSHVVPVEAAAIPARGPKLSGSSGNLRQSLASVLVTSQHSSHNLSDSVLRSKETAGHKETATLLSDKSSCSSCRWRFLTCTVLQWQEQWGAHGQSKH